MKQLYLFLFIISSLFSKGVDILVCSFNRPLQLYSLLESIEKRVSGYNKMFVICRADPDYTEGYRIVENDFPSVKFIYQPLDKVENSFKPIVLEALYQKVNAEAQYFLFAMDDMVILDEIDLNYGSELLFKQPDVHGIYYRLGKNITKAEFVRSKSRGIPSLKQVAKDVFKWDFTGGNVDWQYPNTLDFTMYRKSTFKNAFFRLDYKNPNSLEGALASKGPKGKFGLCHGHSKIVNMPMNRVNTEYANDTIGNYSIEDLLKIFMNGKKMDIFSIDNSKVESAHQDMDFSIIDR